MMGNVFVNGGIILGVTWILIELMDWVATLSFSKKHCKFLVRVAVLLALSCSMGMGWLGATIKHTAQEVEVERLFKTASNYNMESVIDLKATQ